MYNIYKDKGKIMGKKAKKVKDKWLYSFFVEQEKEVEEETDSVDEKGEAITIKKMVTKEVPITFKLRRPTRKLIDDADLHYSVKLSEGIKAGLLTRNLIARRYDDDGGLFNEDDKAKYMRLYNELVEKENLYHKLMLKEASKKDGKKELSKETKTKGEQLLLEITDARKQIMEYEQAQQQVFDNTAENRARNSAIMWWVLHISYMLNDEGKEIPVFPGNTYEEKINYYDTLEEEYDEFVMKYINKLAFLVSFWYTGRIDSEEDFRQAEKTYNNDYVREEEEVDPEDDVAVKAHTEKVERETEEKRAEAKSKEKEKEVKKAPDKKTEESKEK